MNESSDEQPETYSSNSISDHVGHHSFSCFSNAFGERFAVWYDKNNECGWFITDDVESEAVMILDGYLMGDLLLRDAENGFLEAWWGEHADTEWNTKSLDGLYRHYIEGASKKILNDEEFDQAEKVVFDHVVRANNTEAEAEWLFIKEGKRFRIRGFGEEGQINSNGCQHFLKLIERPEEPISVFELLQIDAFEIVEKVSRQEVVDNGAIKAVRKRKSDLEDDLEIAQDTGNPDRCEEIEAELEQINEALRFGRHGNKAAFKTSTKKLQNRISSARRRAIDEMRDPENRMPKLASHFEASITSSGATFRYSPVGCIPKWKTF